MTDSNAARPLKPGFSVDQFELGHNPLIVNGDHCRLNFFNRWSGLLRFDGRFARITRS